jgi:mycothiol synthase
VTPRQRSFADNADLRAMAGLVEALPEQNLHVVDFPYRLCSWGLDEPGNVGLWFNADGGLRAWVVMQTPFWCIGIVLHPAEQRLYSRLLAWAEQRAAALVNGAYSRPAWFVHVPAGPARQTTRLPELEAVGFASQAEVSENAWSMVLMQHSGRPLPESKNQAGFAIRPLAGQAEVEGYVACHQAAFQSANMRAGWRARTLAQPAYQPDLDLVAVEALGRVAGFCIAWLNAQGGQIEPLGVHPEYRGRGLGRALLAEGIRRLQGRGVGRILAATDDFREAACGLYESVDFRVIEPVWVYRKDWNGGLFARGKTQA